MGLRTRQWTLCALQILFLHGPNTALGWGTVSTTNRKNLRFSVNQSWHVTGGVRCRIVFFFFSSSRKLESRESQKWHPQNGDHGESDLTGEKERKPAAICLFLRQAYIEAQRDNPFFRLFLPNSLHCGLLLPTCSWILRKPGRQWHSGNIKLNHRQQITFPVLHSAGQRGNCSFEAVPLVFPQYLRCIKSGNMCDLMPASQPVEKIGKMKKLRRTLSESFSRIGKFCSC